MDFYAPVTALKGVGPKAKEYYEALDIQNVGALLYHFPRAYISYPRPVDAPNKELEGQRIAIYVTLDAPVSVKKTAKMDISIATGHISDTKIELIWFRMPYMRSRLFEHKGYIFYGDLKQIGNHKFQIMQPAVFDPNEYDGMMRRLHPVYPLTKGLKNQAVIKAISQLFDNEALVREYLPDTLLKKRRLNGFSYAIRQIHQPDDYEALDQARNRLVYDEFLSFFIRRESTLEENISIPNEWNFENDSYYNKVMESLPFSLTFGQKETLSDIRKSFAGDVVSQRLLQGDVGSGKTVIAFLAMLLAVENGYQAAIMAPTEVLARQHEKTFLSYVKMFDLPFGVVCVTGSMPRQERRQVNERIKNEGGLFIIGTHALLSEGMEYHSLAVAVTDEQHRFGVRQRKLFSQKGVNPHVIVMSATPIPRTLAMILYGGMQISVIKDVPAKRLRTKNAIISADQRDKAYDFIEKEVRSGHQAYVICPLVDASEQADAQNVTEYVSQLKSYYHGKLSIGMLHGRMTPAEKDAVMKDFAEAKIDVLVSTTVVEVGVNVPNATVMMIEDANRFGLAQLHQLRGRVGRGEWQSFCMFVNNSRSDAAKERLSILVESNDGFHIASEDLKLRGPGDFYGVRQSGDMDFTLADIYQDADIMKKAAEDAKEIVSSDPKLESDEYRLLKEHINDMDSVIYTNL